MTRHYVGIKGLDLTILAFFCFQLMEEDDDFALFVDNTGEHQIIDKNPLTFTCKILTMPHTSHSAQ